MNNKIRHINQKSKKTASNQVSKGIGLRRQASRLLLMGQPIILLALCDYAAQLYNGWTVGEIGILDKIGDIGGYITVALAVLWGGALGLDLLERRQEQDKM